MLVALLAVLGVELIVFVAFVAVVLYRRRADRGRRHHRVGQPDASRAAIDRAGHRRRHPGDPARQGPTG
jgi:hypothetical protein